MTIDAKSGALAWTPAVGDVGTNLLTVSVSDGKTATTRTVTITTQ